MTVTTPKLGLPKAQGPDNARDYLKGAIAGGGLWRAMEILDNAILSTASITLDDVTLNNPTIVGWENAQHTHASTAQAGSTLGPATTLSTPVLQTPAVQGVMSFGVDTLLDRAVAGTLRITGTTGVTRAMLELRSPTSTNSARFGQVVPGAVGAWLTANADYDGTSWLRDDVSKGAWHMNLGTTDNADGAVGFSILQQKAGANPIASWLSRLVMNNAGTIQLTPDAFGLALEVLGTVSIQGNYIYLGPRGNSPGNGGALRCFNDGGAQHWLTGLLTSPGARDFDIYDLVRNSRVFTIGAANGALTLTPITTSTAAIQAAGNIIAAGAEGQPESVRLGSAYSQPGVYSSGRIWVRSETAMGLVTGNGTITVTAGGGNISLHPGGTLVHPAIDNTIHLGYSNVRWNTVWAVAGAINTSSQDAKTDITPLAPADAMAAVRATEAVRFTYRLPPLPPPTRRPVDRFDWKAVRDYQIARPKATAALTQHGFTTEQADPLFVTGTGQSSPQNSVGVLLAALKDLDTRLSALEGA